jgi:hypothetical protein
MWDLWWINWHRDRVFSELFNFSLSISFRWGYILMHHLGMNNRQVRSGSSETQSHSTVIITTMALINSVTFLVFGLYTTNEAVGTD